MTLGIIKKAKRKPAFFSGAGRKEGGKITVGKKQNNSRQKGFGRKEGEITVGRQKGGGRKEGGLTLSESLRGGRGKEEGRGERKEGGATG